MLIKTPASLDLIQCARVLSTYPGFVWLDSNDPNHTQSRYSTLAIQPIKTWHNDANLDEAKNFWQQEHSQTQANLPPFQGGFIGALSYDFGLQQHIPTRHNKHTPCWLGYYPNIISYDHQKQCGWLIIQDAHHPDQERRYQAEQTLKIYQKAIASSQINKVEELEFSPWQQTHTANAYQKKVRACQEAILQGDFFQANLTQNFTAQLLKGSPFETYMKWRQTNPAPFSAFMQCTSALALASISPEQFIHCHQQQVRTSPIKGTIAKHKDPIQDQRNKTTLSQSLKDKAENIMIVDLMRNDLSLCCEDHSIQVEKLCQIETFSQVHHLVSTVTGQLKKNLTPWDLLIQSMPGGSITGAPKIESMKWLAHHEQRDRSYYCGSLFAIGRDDYLQSSILIRTIEFNHHTMHYGAGGAITLHSEPEKEYEESCLKAKSFCQLVESCT